MSSSYFKDTDALMTQVLSWYVTCPLHKTHRSCTKTMQENQGGRDIVIRKLLFWVARGRLFAVPLLSMSIIAMTP